MVIHDWHAQIYRRQARSPVGVRPTSPLRSPAGAPDQQRAASVKKFLIHGEKFSSCNASFFRSRALSPSQPLSGVSEFVVVGPLDEFELKPDLALFLCNPSQASRLVTLSTYETGIPVVAQLSSSTCGGAVAIPLALGRINVTFLDMSSRHLVKGFKDSDLFFSVPYFLLRSIVESIPLSTAGTAEPGMGFGEVMNRADQVVTSGVPGAREANGGALGS